MKESRRIGSSRKRWFVCSDTSVYPLKLTYWEKKADADAGAAGGRTPKGTIDVRSVDASDGGGKVVLTSNEENVLGSRRKYKLLEVEDTDKTRLTEAVAVSKAF
jgi:hypothetical protein